MRACLRRAPAHAVCLESPHSPVAIRQPLPWFRTSSPRSTGPLHELEQRILESMPAIERWFRLEWQEHTPPFYASVDLRNAGFKLAPVDTNLFPGGFNNLTTEMLPLACRRRWRRSRRSARRRGTCC